MIKYKSSLIRSFIQHTIVSKGKYIAKNGIYKNWNGSEEYAIKSFVEPKGTTLEVETQIQELIQTAIKNYRKIRVVGTGHHFNDVSQSSDIMLSLNKFDTVIDFEADGEYCNATVQAGIKMYQLIDILSQHGYCLSNIGNFNQQTLAAVLVSATHGTSGKETSHIHDNVQQIRLIDGKGERISDVPKHLWCHLGFLGIVTEIKLRCPRIYHLEKTEEWCNVYDTLINIDTTLKSHDFVMLKLLGTSPYGRLLKYNRTNKKNNSLIKYFLKYNIFNYLIEPHIEIFILKIMSFFLSPKLYFTFVNQIYKFFSLDKRPFVQAQPYVLSDTCATIYHMESEWAIAREDGVQALRELQETLKTVQENYLYEIHLRFSSSSSLWIDPAFGRETLWINFNVCRTRNFFFVGHQNYNNTPFMKSIHSIMKKYKARPHWCKMHDFTAEEIAPLYPHYLDFKQACKTYDPHSIFSNLYSQRVFGIYTASS